MKGARVEQEVRQFLIDFLPERYQYSSGIVIDSSGSECDRSKQEDLLIIDKFFNPKLFLDEEPTIYPVEVVYCGIEVKTSLNDSKKFKEAVNNIANLKKLNFVREKIAYPQGGGLIFSETRGPLGLIFAFDSSIQSAETLLKHFHEALEGISQKDWPDFVCILNRGILGITEGQKPAFQLFGLLDDTGREITVNKHSTEFTFQSQQYPVMKMDGNYYAVDIARTFVAFLNHLYDRLLSKVIMSNSNLLRHYIPREITKNIGVVYQDSKINLEQDR
ncbi:MAG TPA: hypothetical protein DCP31_16900 [Cyanobacteria bacterium UBA8543]|nr:hypothetical protein [Cyanobacteria bacterium UBA8543]